MVYIFLATGFEEMEALITADILRRCSVEVSLVGVTGEHIEGAHGITVKSDISIDDVKPGAEMLILPGGMPGVTNLYACEKLREMLTEQNSRGGYIAAICAAPSILGQLGILKGKRAVCYPGFEDKLTGARIETDVTVSADGNIITSKAAGTTFDFAYRLARLLRGKKEADRVIGSVFYKLDEQRLD
jgi:4-methyl-5(b-hydroxyethyl)-thiazole monophosphate biosynthesis